MNMDHTFVYNLTIGMSEDSPSFKEFTRILTLMTFIHQVETGMLQRTLTGPAEFIQAHRRFQNLFIEHQPSYWVNHQAIMAATTRGWPDTVFTLDAYTSGAEPPVHRREYYRNGEVQITENGDLLEEYDPDRLIDPRPPAEG